MNHITLYAYEEDGELFVYRCPVCGSPGAPNSMCGHEPPSVDAYKHTDYVHRVPVRVPQVEEEQRYTLEQVREPFAALAAELRQGLAYYRDRIEQAEQERETEGDRAARLRAEDRDASLAHNGKVMAIRSVTDFDHVAGWLELHVLPKLDAAFDHFTQQPAGIGAAAPASSAAEVPGSADSDGNQQPLGGDADVVQQAGNASVRRQVAGGGSGQGAGSALQQLREEILKICDGVGKVGSAYDAADIIWEKVSPHLATQHPSGGQEEGVTQKDFDRAEQLIAEGKLPGGQEGGVEE